MRRALLVLLTLAGLLAGPSVRCAMGAALPDAGPSPSCCDPDPNGHGVPTAPCWSMACCVLFVTPLPQLTLTDVLPCGPTPSAETSAPDTHSVRPPTPPPRAAGIA